MEPTFRPYRTLRGFPSTYSHYSVVGIGRLSKPHRWYLKTHRESSCRLLVLHGPSVLQVNPLESELPNLPTSIQSHVRQHHDKAASETKQKTNIVSHKFVTRRLAEVHRQLDCRRGYIKEGALVCWIEVWLLDRSMVVRIKEI